ncbi:MAG: hypothetical protein KJ064_00395 [Anaerolineae bacterium]|nr:hypothetical protein [Anaerolineae bacterium]
MSIRSLIFIGAALVSGLAFAALSDQFPVLALPSLFAPSFLLLTLFNGTRLTGLVTLGLWIHAVTAALDSFKLTGLTLTGLGIWTIINLAAVYQISTRPTPALVRNLVSFSGGLCLLEILLILTFYLLVFESMA